MIIDLFDLRIIVCKGSSSSPRDGHWKAWDLRGNRCCLPDGSCVEEC